MTKEILFDQNRELKSCGHYCYPSKLTKCCACEDTRTLSPDGKYEAYVDGVGWINSATRDDGYCPACNTKNYDRWMERVKEQTERKRSEDEKKKAEESRRRAIAEEDRQRIAALAGGNGEDGDDDDQQVVRVEYSNGNVYLGTLVNGEPHGSGRMDYADNDDDILYYEGEWKNGKHEGSGKKVWMDDMWYNGEWKDGKMHGDGTFHVNEVDIMEGRFEEDVFQD